MYEIGSNRGASYFVNKAPNTAAFVATTIAFATAFARGFDLIIAAGVLVSHVSEHTSAFGRKPPQKQSLLCNERYYFILCEWIRKSASFVIS